MAFVLLHSPAWYYIDGRCVRILILKDGGATMVVYLIAQDSHGDPCVVAVSAHYHLPVVNAGLGPYDFYPGQDILKYVQE